MDAARLENDAPTPEPNVAPLPTLPADTIWVDPTPAAAAQGVPLWLAGGAGVLVGGLVIALLGLLLLGSPNSGRTRLATGAAAPANGTPLYEGPAVGYLAPHFTLTGLDGTTTALQSLRGRPVWVKFWATWCPPCRAEMPEMKKFYAKYRNQGLVILGVDLAEDPNTVQKFVQENGYDWTFLLDRDSRVAQSYNAGGIPTHAFVDANGVIQGYSTGGLPPDQMEGYLAKILPK